MNFKFFTIKRKIVLISITPYSSIRTYHKYNISRPTFNGGDINSLMEEGDKFLNENKAEKALESYKKALEQSPENTEINRKIAKAYHRLKDYNSAEENIKIYLTQNEEDAEGWIELGEIQRQKGDYNSAVKSFKTALSIDPNNDLAKRSITETQNNTLSIFSPQKAYTEKQKYAQENLKTALKMAVDYMTPEYMKDLADIQIKFGKTASMGGTSNIAQYENSIKTITISDEYQYAAPQVIAAYLVHESVHAKDKDAYTSIREEQDAYETATKFWIQNANGVKDPEMDYAAELYKKSPEALSQRVEEIYVLRDPSIAKTSPNHPPTKKSFFLFPKKAAANQPIKSYNIIA